MAERILITRLSAVGDCILTMPLLCGVRKAFPRAQIGWVVERGAAPILRGHRCLDHLISLPKGWLTSPQQMLAARRELQAFRPTITLDAQSLTRSAAAAWLSGAKHRIGFAAPQGRELAVWLNGRQVTKTAEHVVDAHLELLTPLDPSPTEVVFDVPRDEQAVETMGSVVGDPRLASGFAVINPGAGWDSKLWPADRFAQVADMLGRRLQLPSLVVWAGDRERAWAEEIVTGSGGHAQVAPSTKLPELAELLRSARLFVGSDTGPLHLAAAVGTPCVGIYGPTRPAHCGPYGDQHRTVQAYYQGGPKRRRAENHAMRAVTVDQVNSACQQVVLSPSSQVA